MAEAVVDLLEAVQIHDQEGELAVLPLGRQDRLLKAVVEERPVGQVGQRVVQRLVLEQLGLRLSVADVLQHPDQVERLLLGAADQ